MQSEEIELIEGAKAGDKEAFGELYEMYLKKIYRFLHYQVKDGAEAEDLTEQVFVKAWTKLKAFEFRSTGTFQAWLFQIARNLGLDYLRRKPTVNLAVIAEQGEEDNVEEKIDANAQQQRLMNAIDRLPASLRQVVMLKYFEDLPYEEMAQVLGKRQGAVRVMVHRALKRLKLELKNI